MTRLHSTAALALLLGLAGCAGMPMDTVPAGDGGPVSGEDAAPCAGDCGDDALGELLGGLPATWPELPPERDEVVESTTTTSRDGARSVVCVDDTHDVQRNFEDLLALGEEYARVQPGTLVQGDTVFDGRMRAVPLARGPLTLTIDLPVTHPSRRVEQPSMATLQEQVGSLQRDADSQLGELPDLPARIRYTSQIVDSFEQASLEVDVSLAYNGGLVSAGLDTELTRERSYRTHTVIARLYQPMYTISVGDDELGGPRAFFAPDLADEDVAAQMAAGTIGPENLPAYVASVTYGRIVLFTMTSDTVASADELYAAVNGSFRGFSGDASARARYESIVSTARVQVLALGGSADEANLAIRTGDYGRFFGPATAATAVPLSFEVRYIMGTREIARIGDHVRYSVQGCTVSDVPPEVFTARFDVGENSGAIRPVSTGLTLVAGDHVVLDASGDIWAGVLFTGSNGPAGWSAPHVAPDDFPVPGARPYSLIAKIGTGPWFYVGAHAELTADRGGLLVLGTNDSVPGNGNEGALPGGFTGTATVTRPAR
jgi:hypothetical protein